MRKMKMVWEDGRGVSKEKRDDKAFQIVRQVQE
jgi:hypothetical protein